MGLYCFVHCKDSKQGIKLINKWEGKMMSKSKSNLQVRFKNIPNKTTTYYNNQNQAMGDMNNMQRPNQYGMNNMNNMGFMNQQQQGFNNRNMQNQFVNRQQWNNPMQGGMMDNFGNNMQGGYNKNNNRQGGFNNRQQPHFNNQMNDGNNQFRGNQQHPQQQMYGNMINNRR